RPDTFLATQDPAGCDEDRVIRVIGDDLVKVARPERLDVVGEYLLRRACHRFPTFLRRTNIIEFQYKSPLIVLVAGASGHFFVLLSDPAGEDVQPLRGLVAPLVRPAEVPFDVGELSRFDRRDDGDGVVQHEVQWRHLDLEPAGHPAYVV